MFLRPCCRWRQCWVPGEQCQMIQTKLHRQESQIFNSTTGEQTGYIVVWKGSLKEVAVLGTDSLVGTHKTRKTKILDFFLFTFWHCSQCNQYKAWKRQVLRYDVWLPYCNPWWPDCMWMWPSRVSHCTSSHRISQHAQLYNNPNCWIVTWQQ